MAIYICDECGHAFDDDYHPCVDHPTDGDLFCCEECASLIEQEQDDEFKSIKAAYEREIIAGVKL